MNKYKEYRTIIIVGVSCLLIGKYVLQTKQKVEVREVIRYVEKKDENKKIDRVVRIKEEKKPDGTIITETDIKENESSQTSTVSSQYEERTKKITGRGISIGVLALKDLNSIANKSEIGVLTSIPIFGKISVIGSIDTTKRVGVGISLEF